MPLVSSIVKEDIRNVYQFEKLLGRGRYGSVRKARRLGLAQDKYFAIKTMVRD